MKIIDKIALVLIIIGAINWGLIGLFRFNLVELIFGDMKKVDYLDIFQVQWNADTLKWEVKA